MASELYINTFLSLEFPEWELKEGMGITVTKSGSNRTVRIKKLIRKGTDEWKPLCSLKDFDKFRNGELGAIIRQILSQ